MKRQLNISISLLLLTILASCGSGSNGLKIKEDEEIKFVQRESKIIKGSDGDIEIYIGDVTMGLAQIKITGIENNKLYFDEELSQSDDGYFKYGDSMFYRIKVNKFENHLLHDDLAFISIRSVDKIVGMEKASEVKENNSPKFNPDDARTVFNRIKNSKLRFIRNGEILDDTTMAKHIETKYVLNSEDIKTNEEFYNRILTKSMTSGETYKVIRDKDTINLIDWVTGN